MENLDFGWKFVAIMILISLLSFYLITAAYYLAHVFLGNYTKKILNHFDYYQIQKEGIIKTAIPLVIASVIIALVNFVIFYFIKLPLEINTEVLDLLHSPHKGYLGDILFLSYLSLSRYSFSEKWLFIKQFDTKTCIKNFFIYTTLLGIILTFILKNIVFDFFPFKFGYRYLYALILLYSGYILLKKRNIDKQMID